MRNYLWNLRGHVQFDENQHRRTGDLVVRENGLQRFDRPVFYEQQPVDQLRRWIICQGYWKQPLANREKEHVFKFFSFYALKL